MAEYVRSLVEIEENTKQVIPPFEVDVFVPQKNIAIEFNGLYWHSELCKDKDYHYKKFLKCKEKQINLLQFYEDEWNNKQDVCKSVIKHKLGFSERVYARKLLINESPDKEKVKLFLNANHLQGYCRSIKDFSLEDTEGNILGVLTLRKPFTPNSLNMIEIARFSTSVAIPGGFSKLMKYVKEWSQENNYSHILTYSDCRYSWGQVYEKYGFSFSGHTGLGFDYTDGETRCGRSKFRTKNKKSEKDITKEAGVFRIYNAGNYRWTLKV